MTKPNLNAFYSPVLQTTRVSEKHEKKHKPQHPQGSNYSKPIFINHKTKQNIYNAPYRKTHTILIILKV